MAAEDIAYKYTGGDPSEAHHSGIPARDLTRADYEGLDKEHRETLRRSAIYEKVEAAKAEPKPSEEKAEAKSADKK